MEENGWQKQLELKSGRENNNMMGGFLYFNVICVTQAS